ncbi:ERAD-associated protein [Mortierella claussenii]|nr:ERAD-associated protein [Mortierella claussenii]
MDVQGGKAGGPMTGTTVRKRVLLGCTVLLALTLVANGQLQNKEAIHPNTEQHQQQQQQQQQQQHFNLGIEKFRDYAAAQDKAEHGKRLYQEAMKLLESSTTKVNQRVFIKQQSTLARSFLSDELQKQKGIVPTALRLVTQGFMSFFKKTPTPSSASSSSATASTTVAASWTKEGTEDAQAAGATTAKKHALVEQRHRDPIIAKAMGLLQRAGYELDNDEALWTLANIHFHGQYKAKRDLSQAFDLYATLADRSGNSTAQQMVGFMYSTGLGNAVERDEAKAMLYTTFAAWGNNTAAELTLGYKYMFGIGTKKSCQHSVDYYKRAADKAYAMYQSGPPLGRTMPLIKARLTDSEGGTYGAGASGPGAPSKNHIASDIQDFIEFHRYIAEGDDPQARDAQYQLGILFYTGNAGSTTTIPRDYQKAGMYFERVADFFFSGKSNILESKEPRTKEMEDQIVTAGITAALLGKMYWRGEGYQVDEAMALSWFRKSAKLGNQVALNALGTMYMRGAAGLSVDHEQAIKYIKMAADLHYPDAQVNMGLYYLTDPKRYDKAFQYFFEAAQAQNFQAVYHLGEMFYYGLGAVKKCDEAARYFKYVAERGDWDDTLFPDSYDAYQAGDVEYAAIGYLQAAERGFEVGQSNFAWILDRELPTSHYVAMLTSPARTALEAIGESALVSLGTPARLLEMALVYWTRSANQGDVDARVKMGDYYFSGIGTDADFKKAMSCYQVAAEAEHSAMAMWNLGWMHENGIGAVKDFHLAKRWYDRSLSTNPGATLPVTLSLFKLNARYIWSYLTGGETGSDAASFWSINGKSSESSSEANGPDSINAQEGGKGNTAQGGATNAGGNSWDLNKISENGIEKWRTLKQTGPGDEAADYDETDPFQQQQQLPPRPKGSEEEEAVYDDFEDDLVETLVIIGLCMVVGYLMYVRQFRFANQNQNQNQNNRQQGLNGVANGNHQHQQQPPIGGLPGDPNAPGRFAYYAAGG